MRAGPERLRLQRLAALARDADALDHLRLDPRPERPWLPDLASVCVLSHLASTSHSLAAGSTDLVLARSQMARTRSSSSSPTSSRRSSRTRFDAAASPISGRRHPRSRSELCAVVGWARVGEGERAVAGRARRNEGARPQDRGRLESRAWGGTRCCSCSSRNVRYRRPSSSSSSAAARRHLEGAERPSQVEQLNGAGSSVQRLLSFEFSPRRKSLLFLGAGRKSLAQLGVTSLPARCGPEHRQLPFARTLPSFTPRPAARSPPRRSPASSSALPPRPARWSPLRSTAPSSPSRPTPRSSRATT